MSNRIRRDVKCALRFAPASTEELASRQLSSQPDGFVAGWASTPAEDSYGTIFQARCFDAAIARRGLTGPTGVKFLLNHNRSQLAGVITKLETRGDRLWIEAQLNLDIGYVRDAYSAAKMAGGLNFSVGARIEEYSIDRKTDVITFTRCDLPEVSMVPLPGNDEAQMVEIRSALIDGDTDQPQRRVPEGARQAFDDDEFRDALDDPAQSLAEFEKRLIAIGFVSTRNDARRLTQVVKAAAHLFQRTEPALDAGKPAQPAPEATDHNPAVLEALRALRIKATAPVAAE